MPCSSHKTALRVEQTPQFHYIKNDQDIKNDFCAAQKIKHHKGFGLAREIVCLKCKIRII